MSIDISTLLTFLTGIGFGSIITAFVQHNLNRRAKHSESLFNERKSAFDGFLVSYADLSCGWTREKAQHLGLCRARIELVASRKTVLSLNLMMETEPKTEERDHTQSQLIENMRTDLGLA